MSDLTERIQSEANIATRPGQMARLEGIAVEVGRLERGGAELGKTLQFWLDLAVDVTNSHDVIEEDGDGDWGLIAERLAAMKPAPKEAAR